jgi:asparagine synthase (glutamine-hydrolysing)
MCGIAGICGMRSVSDSKAAVSAMLVIMAHRGPDGEGIWVDPGGGCVLGHRRLAIIDPAGGHQPMTNEDQTIWITFNGCIYNYLDVAKLLRQKGHVFRSNSDTEVIIHAYEEWGTQCVHHFNGMWAFAVWDSRERMLFCSRDRLGVKPFYYALEEDTIFFASEIKALIEALGTRAEIDPDGLRQYVTFQYCLGETTLFKGIRRLQPGHNLTIKMGELRVWSFWDLVFHVDEEHDEDYCVDRLGWLLQDSVRLRLRSDVPLGAHLSGGLDSTTVACMARMLLGDIPVKTFTGAFSEGPEFDETRYAKAASSAADTEYLEIYLTAKDFAESIERIIWFMDEPAAGPGVFPQYWVSKLAAGHVKVILGGQGGDEIFIGYARYLIAYLEECLRGAIEQTAHRARYVATLETIVKNLPTLDRYLPMLRHFFREGLFDEPARRYFRLMDRFSEAEQIINEELRLDTKRSFEEFREVFQSAGEGSMINQIMAFDVKTHLQALLHVEDRTSMASGLESRVPLLDYRLLGFMASVPPVIKFKDGELKYLFRRAVKSLVPPLVFNRRDKMGFPVPLSMWVRGELRDFFRDILLSRRCRERNFLDVPALERHLSSPRPFERALWGALCLELWCKQFLDH